MNELLYASALYVAVFGIDYLFYVKQKSHYKYVSRRTFALFVTGQIAALLLFIDLFKPYIANFFTETAFIAVFTVLMVTFTYQLTKDNVLVCNLGSRTFRCLTPWYVLVKGAEIIFQQLIYVALAISLANLLGINVGTYIAYTAILLIIHTVVIVGCTKSIAKRLTFGVFAMAVPMFYIFTVQELFWPAVYVHGIMYVFSWITFADFDVLPSSTKKVDN